jgi:hypothetical protein
MHLKTILVAAVSTLAVMAIAYRIDPVRKFVTNSKV